MRVRHLLIGTITLGLSVGLLLVWANRVDEPLPDGVQADKVLVRKGARQLVLLRDGVALKTYRIALGRCPVGQKLQEGDNRTPEGSYFIDWRNPKNQSYLSLHV